MAKRQRRRKKKRLGTVLFVLEIFVLLILLAGVFLYAKITDKLDLMGGKEFNLENVGFNDSVIGATEYNEVTQDYQVIALVGVDSRDGGLESGQSDTMMLACINNKTKEVRLISIYRDTLLRVGEDSEGNGRYRKANYAYNAGGPEQFLTMLNSNLDLMVTDYVTVDFSAVAVVVDLLGGIEVDLTSEEIGHLNNYCVETSEVTGGDYKKIPESEPGVHTLNGVQAVSYCRIRYTSGNDFMRTARQRLVISKMVEKAMRSDLSTLTAIMDEVFPMISTSFSKTEIVKLGSSLLAYNFGETTGFPFSHYMLDVEMWDLEDSLDCVAPITLESNVKELHQWLYGIEDYQVSEELKAYSDRIVDLCGYGDEYIEKAHNAAISAAGDGGSEAAGM